MTVVLFVRQATDTLAYLAPLVVVGVLSYIAGFETCALTSHRAHAHHPPRSVAVVAHPTPPATPSDRPRRMIGGVDAGVVGYLLAALALTIAGFTAYQENSHWRDQIGCLNMYANGNYAALQALREPAQLRDKALNRVMRSVDLGFKGQATRADVERAVHDFRALNARLAHERAVHPYPDPPKVVCP